MDPDDTATLEAIRRIDATNDRCLRLAVEALGRIKNGQSSPTVEATLALHAIDGLLSEDVLEVVA